MDPLDGQGARKLASWWSFCQLFPIAAVVFVAAALCCLGAQGRRPTRKGASEAWKAIESFKFAGGLASASKRISLRGFVFMCRRNAGVCGLRNGLHFISSRSIPFHFIISSHFVWPTAHTNKAEQQQQQLSTLGFPHQARPAHNSNWPTWRRARVQARSRLPRVTLINFVRV